MRSFRGSVVLVGMISVATVSVEAVAAPWRSESRVTAQLQWDDNPTAVGRGTTGTWPDQSAWGTTTGLFLGWRRTGGEVGATGWVAPDATIDYAVDATRYAGFSAENHTDHRLNWKLARQLGDWRWELKGAEKYIDGEMDTWTSAGGASSFGVAQWREHRAQWLHRIDGLAQWEGESGRLRLRGVWLDQDFRTALVAGRVPFVDRADSHLDADWGRVSRDGNWWLVGTTVGGQHQAQSPLAGAQFDYSSRYVRTVAGWEGRWLDRVKVAVRAGPEWRHFDGAVDSAVMPDRDEASLFGEASLSGSAGRTFEWTGRATRWQWLTSTGRGAYTDTLVEATVNWKPVAAWTGRGLAKLQNSRYLTAQRDDTLYSLGLGGTWRPREGWEIGCDVLHQFAHNGTASATGRTYDRNVVSASVRAQF